MKRFFLTLSFCLLSLRLLAGDATVSTLVPQNGDDPLLLSLRSAKALSLLISNGLSITSVGVTSTVPTGVFFLTSTNLLKTNLTVTLDTASGGTAVNRVLAQGFEIQNAARSAGGGGILNSFSVFWGDSDSNAPPSFHIILTAAPITWGTNGAQANLVASELATNFLDVIDGTSLNWLWTGTNGVATVAPKAMHYKAATNSIFGYMVSDMTNTNTNACVLSFGLDRE